MILVGIQSGQNPLYVNGQVNPSALLEFYKEIRENAEVTDEEAASLVAYKYVYTSKSILDSNFIPIFYQISANSATFPSLVPNGRMQGFDGQRKNPTNSERKAARSLRSH
jgi:hypothetical protein